jgi:hypothetical protein
MELPQGNSLCSYLRHQKYEFFLPFLYKIREQGGRTGPAWGDWYQWAVGRDGEMVKEGEYGANTVYTCI